MKLNIIQRIQILSLVPKKGSFEDLVVGEDLIKKIGLTQKEIKDYEIKTVDNMVTVKNNKEADFDFTELEKNIIKQELDKLEKSKSLESNLLSLYRLFNL